MLLAKMCECTIIIIISKLQKLLRAVTRNINFYWSGLRVLYCSLYKVVQTKFTDYCHKVFHFACGRAVTIYSDFRLVERPRCLYSISQIHRPCPSIRALEIKKWGWVPGHCISTVMYLKSENPCGWLTINQFAPPKMIIALKFAYCISS